MEVRDQVRSSWAVRFSVFLWWWLVWTVPAVLVMPGRIFSISGYVGFKMASAVVLALLWSVAGYIGMRRIGLMDDSTHAWVFPAILNLVFAAFLLLEPDRNMSSTVAAFVLPLSVGVGMWIAIGRGRQHVLRLAFAATLGFTLLLAMAAGVLGLRDYVMSSESMAPSLLEGDVVWSVASRWGGPIDTGDVVVLHDPDDSARVLVRRVTATAGERVPSNPSAIVPNGDVYVSTESSGTPSDGESYGPFPVANIIGRVRVVVWPLSHWRLVEY